jgi:hypothetical protein
LVNPLGSYPKDVSSNLTGVRFYLNNITTVKIKKTRESSLMVEFQFVVLAVAGSTPVFLKKTKMAKIA